MRDSGIRLDSSDCSSTSSSILPLTPLERLIRTHPIWFLPDVDRLEAAQILHMKETGVRNDLFSIVRLISDKMQTIQSRMLWNINKCNIISELHCETLQPEGEKHSLVSEAGL